jgi:hypothetical protein
MMNLGTISPWEYCIALFNPEFDLELIKNNKNLDAHYNKEYLLFKLRTLMGIW